MVGLGPTIHVFADTIKGKTWTDGLRRSRRRGRTSREVKHLLPDGPLVRRRRDVAGRIGRRRRRIGGGLGGGIRGCTNDSTDRDACCDATPIWSAVVVAVAAAA